MSIISKVVGKTKGTRGLPEQGLGTDLGPDLPRRLVTPAVEVLAVPGNTVESPGIVSHDRMCRHVFVAGSRAVNRWQPPCR